MKHILIFAISLLFCHQSLQSQNGIEWSNPTSITISPNAKSPVIEVLEDGTPVVIWGQGSFILFSKIMEDTFTEPITISTDGVNPSIYSFGGLDMATYKNQIYLVYENFSQGVFLIRSLDGGESFESPVNVVTPAPGKWATLASVTTNDEGNPIVSVIMENSNETDARYIVIRSNDGGESFEEAVIANEPADGEFVCECCPSDLHAQGENIWLVFRNNDDNLRDIWVTKSNDGGNSFEQGIDIDAADWVINYCPISGPKMTPLANDSLITIWKSTNRVSFSTLHQQTMEKGMESSVPRFNTASNQNNPHIAGTHNTVGMVWEETDFEETSIDLVFALSRNGTTDLTTNFANITPIEGNQQFPSLTYLNETFHLVYVDGNNGIGYLQGVVPIIETDLQTPNNPLCIKLAKNPILNNINLQINCSLKKFDAQLFDLQGNQLQVWNEYHPSNNEVLNLKEHISNGLYLLSVQSQKGHWSKKIFIQR